MMECNKDEAIRAKDIAEKKMQNNDFEGAQRIAMKAQRLFPELENINQLLTVCNVHCESQSKRLGSEKDFYGILQLEKFADEVAIKKQYRKLAFALHPDKNKLPGAEAAFKLVGEANLVLSDPGKKAVYDSKCKVSVRQAQPPPSQTSTPSDVQETFWTACPYCKFKVRYLKTFVNHIVPCQKCTKTFAAYELSVQGVKHASNMGKPQPKPKPPGKADAQNDPAGQPRPQPKPKPPGKVDAKNDPADQSRPQPKPKPPGKADAQNDPAGQQRRTRGVSASQPRSQGVPSMVSGHQTPVIPTKETPHPGSSRMGEPNAAAIRTGLQECRSNKTVRSEFGMAGSAADAATVKSDNKECSNQNSVAGGKHEGMNANRKQKLSGVGNTCRKRGRIHVGESSESENGSGDGDFQRPSKRSSKSKSSDDNVVKEAVVSKNNTEPCTTSAVNIKADVNSEGNEYSKKSFSEGTQMEKTQKETNTMGHVPGVVDIRDPNPDGTADQTVYHCPDAEFTDFDKEREEHCFDVDQIWAIYDTIDGMPRFYAVIKKVFKPGFKLQINWLEGDPVDDAEISWLNEELPFGCGRFRWGHSQMTSDRLTFSHQVHYELGKNRKSVFVRPRKGEIWALIKDWNINWNCDPENHKKYKYEIVEVVSDFSEGEGIQVSYLDKVRGFFCLFQRASVSEGNILLISPDQMLRFSHRIPSSKMTGTEREGVPVGSFELDPASLPQDPEDICYPPKVIRDNENSQNGNDQLGKKYENVVSPRKYADAEGKTVPELFADFQRRRSPRGKK
ncbi:hypothetical protein LIER_16203 [Lithospermum erythrorhizon]|uniref:J domain-containing protein n=1 Tax=Lithospermum erythrorhizon TaxID=34254 RepID=A0AAV3QB47_LITER